MVFKYGCVCMHPPMWHSAGRHDAHVQLRLTTSALLQAWPEFLRAPFLRALNRARALLQEALAQGPPAKQKYCHVHRGSRMLISTVEADKGIAEGIAWALKGDWEFLQWRQSIDKRELGLDRPGRAWLDGVDEGAR
jgi:hypothetical protein